MRDHGTEREPDVAARMIGCFLAGWTAVLAMRIVYGFEMSLWPMPDWWLDAALLGVAPFAAFLICAGQARARPASLRLLALAFVLPLVAWSGWPWHGLQAHAFLWRSEARLRRDLDDVAAGKAFAVDYLLVDAGTGNVAWLQWSGLDLCHAIVHAAGASKEGRVGAVCGQLRAVQRLRGPWYLVTLR